VLDEARLKQLSNSYKLTPATLAHKLNPRWIAAPHLLYISQKIATAIRKGNARICISVPPRHGKSELITKYTTAWCLEMFPNWNTILATYGAELSADFGKDVRDIIDNNQDKLNVRLSADRARAANWKTTEGGGMAAVGIGGPITGRGANVLLIDDYIKEIKEAMSKKHNEDIWRWFRTVAYTRIEPGGSCIIIATRWAPDDLIGRIVAENPGGHWEYIRLPAIAEAPCKENGYYEDPLGRVPGEALFPERYNEQTLKDIKETTGSFFFNSLYQQNPKSDVGDLTDPAWLKITEQMPDMTRIKKARIWDLAATEDGGDYTVGNLMGHIKLSNSTYIFNIVRDRLSPSGVETLVRTTAIADGTETEIYIEQEPGSSGKALVEHYQKNVLPEFKVVAVPSTDGKLTRAQPFLAAAEAGNIYLIKGHWNQLFIDEFKDFPGGGHDDQIDTASVGYTKLAGRKTLTASIGRGLPATVQDGRQKVTVTGKAGVIFGRSPLNA
jgi:predicted phage terminase large subunit-like protein